MLNHFKSIQFKIILSFADVATQVVVTYKSLNLFLLITCF